MKNYFKLICVALVLQFTFSLSSRADEAATKKEMVQKYQLMKQAYENADLDSVTKELTSDFTAKLPKNRTMNRAQYVASQRRLLDAVTKVHEVILRINTVTLSPNRTVVVVTEYYDFEVRDNRGNPHRLKQSLVTRDTWVQVSNQWKNKLTETIKASIMLDGKKIKS